MAVIAASVLAGCAERTPQEYVRSAEQHLAKSDYASAEVELRNAVRLSNDSGVAHRLLGIARLNLGFASSAETALRRALELGEPADEVLPALARAMIEQGKSDAVVREFGAHPRLRNDLAEAALRTHVADALLAQRAVAEAAEGYAAALAARADHALARVGQARILALDGKAGEALSIVDQVLVAAPQLAQAQILKAELALARGDRTSARQALERALDTNPSHAPVRVALVSLLVDGNEYAAAADLLKHPGSEKDPRFIVLKSLVALRQGRVSEAREHLAPMLKATQVPPLSLTLAGEIELRADNLSLAEDHLRAALASGHNDATARRLLAATYLRQGHASKAIDALKPLLPAKDAALAMLAGEAYLADGDLARASESFEAARSLAQDPQRALLRLGQIALARGDFDAGIDALQAAAAMEGSRQADLTLVAFHLRRLESDKALTAAEAYKKKAPQDHMAHHAAGMARLAGRKLTSARENFEAALKLEADFLPALRALAEVDLAEGKPADAKRRYEAVLARAPDERTFLALAELQRRLRHEEEASATLRTALAKFPRSALLNAALVQQHLHRRDFDAAIAVARKAADLAAEPRLLELLGDTQFATGDGEGAMRTFERIASIESRSAQPLRRLAAVQMSRKEFQHAAEALKSARARAPDDVAIIGELVAAYVAGGKFDRATAAAQALASRSRGSAPGATLLGDVYRAQAKTAEAERAYRAALEADPRATASAIKLCELLIASKRSERCDELAGEWLAANPRDIAMRLYAGERALDAKRLREAAQQYEAVVKHEPANVVANNNLAWVLGELNDPRSLQIAEHAARLAPDNADVLGTLGVLQVGRGQAQQGLVHLAKARALAPHRHDLRLDHAKGLLKAGRVDEGKAELLALASEKAEFRGKQEVPQLLATLTRRAAQ